MKKIVIIGGGFSGATLAMNLCGLTKTYEIHIVEPRKLLGLGVAYSTNEPGHLLNIAAHNMSAWVDRPHDFVGYLVDTNEGLAHLPLEYFNTYYAPRLVFARYMQNLLARNEYQAIIHHQAHAMRVRRSEKGLEVALSNHEIIQADKIVLALGLASSGAIDRIFDWAYDGRYLSNVWDNDSRREFIYNIARHESVLIMGSGLSMIDMLISLEQNKHQGPIYVVSRHGFSPKPHAPLVRTKLTFKNQSPHEWLQIFRSHKENWRAVIEELRPHSHMLWQNFSAAHKHQFLRHLQALWQSHSQRVAPEVYRFWLHKVNSQQIIIRPGRLVKAATNFSGFNIDFKHGHEHFSLNPHRVINCTGQEEHANNIKGSLWPGLIKDGLITPASTGFGFLCDEYYRSVQQSGYQASALYILGASCRAHLQSNDVPELRHDANKLALILAD